jgi:hypothetical protein
MDGLVVGVAPGREAGVLSGPDAVGNLLDADDQCRLDRSRFQRQASLADRQTAEAPAASMVQASMPVRPAKSAINAPR